MPKGSPQQSHVAQPRRDPPSTSHACRRLAGRSPLPHAAVEPRLVAGDVAAFEQVYDRYSGVAFGLAQRLCGGPDLAEDVVQQAFMDLWRTADRFDPNRGTVKAWVLGIVRNRSIDACRRRATARQRISVAVDLALDVPSDQDTFADVAQLLEAAHVRELLDDLPASQRQALTLAYKAELSHSEIGELLSVPLGTVKSRIRIGLDKLRQRLEVPAPRYRDEKAATAQYHIT